ncbi:MAG TPA: hypothetical protein VKT82_10180 [Ktedonobacterales bacterium]|nr:hypothetical protein [Ktedonobacterales bacterium]
MQAPEPELVIATNYRLYYQRVFLLCSLAVLLGSVFCLCLLLFFILYLGVPTDTLPAIQEQARETRQQGIMEFAVGLVLLLALYGLFALLIRDRMRNTDTAFRATQEGIYTSPNALLIRWSEIRTLSYRVLPLMGSAYLRVVLWRGTGVYARALASSASPSVRISLALASLTAFLSPSPTLVVVVEAALPISLEELLTTIQEQFALQLREHHIQIEHRWL